jgi:hypothetical protein
MCPICYEEGMPQGYVELPCHHTHKCCKECITGWARNCYRGGITPGCPVCGLPFFYRE